MFKKITSVLDKSKTIPNEDIEKIPSFIFTRWLSGNQNTIMAANQINLYHNEIPMLAQYNMVKQAFAGKIKFIPYPKNVSSDSSKTIQYLSKHFKISEEKAVDYLSVIDEAELKYLVDLYSEDEMRNK